MLDLSAAFERTSFSPREQQIVLLTTSKLNGCSYCQTVHSTIARKCGMDDATLRAVLDLAPLPEAKENALRAFTQALVETRGWIDDVRLRSFFAAGYTHAKVFECVLGISLKTLTNYCNHIAGAEPNPEFVAMARHG